MIAVLVQTAALQGQGFAAARDFIEHAVATGHTIDSVFLYREAVLGASTAIDLPSDEPDLAQKLRQCCQQHHIDLLYCVTAAEKRGVSHIAPECTAAGLAEFALRLNQVTQVVQF